MTTDHPPYVPTPTYSVDHHADGTATLTERVLWRGDPDDVRTYVTLYGADGARIGGDGSGPRRLPDDPSPAADDEVDLDHVVWHLTTTHGLAAYVQQTGGGCATIEAAADAASLAACSRGYTDEDTDPAHAVVRSAACGPGWFTGPAWTMARATPEDLWIGPNGDDADAGGYPLCPGTTDPAAIAAAIAAVVATLPALPADAPEVTP